MRRELIFGHQSGERGEEGIMGENIRMCSGEFIVERMIVLQN
jgi:hypothetical protein